MRWDFRIFPRRNMSQNCPFLMVMTAFFENMTVWALALGRANLAKTIPAMHDEIITPKILCRHTRIIVSGHFSVVCLEPYLQSKKIVLDKGLHPSLLRPSCSKGQRRSQILSHLICHGKCFDLMYFWKKNDLALWENPIYPIQYPDEQDLGFF